MEIPAHSPGDPVVLAYYPYGCIIEPRDNRNVKICVLYLPKIGFAYSPTSIDNAGQLGAMMCL